MKTKDRFCKYFNPNRYNKPFFVNETIQNAIKEYGFYVIDLLGKDDIDKLLKGFESLREAVQGDFGDQFWPSGRHNNPDVRNLAKRQIEAIVQPKFKPIFIRDIATFIGGTYLIKPPSKNSALSPHQDSSHLNELEFFSVYAWIPLQNVDDSNGAVKVLPGSHRIDIKQRSLNVPWILEPYIKLLDEYMISVPMKAGQVLLFDAALIHSSPPNLSREYRVAVNFYIHNSQSPFTHFYRNENTPTGHVEMYAVTPEFYYSEDFESKPSEKYPFMGYQQQFIPSISENELKNLLDVISNKKESFLTKIRNTLGGKKLI